MIKSVRIQNFEAHEDTTVDFVDNMNLIIGMSNAGKSAVIRALGVVVNNEWTKEMVRSGCEFCRIKVETEKGWVECERGEKINRWKCCENNGEIQNYRNVGIKVPDMAVKILGMGERDRGSGIKELPNFQFQLEKHYMLSEIGEKKSTSNMIAVMMDNAIGLGGMEELIKAVSADLTRDRRWVSEKQSEVAEMKKDILDEVIYESYCRLVEKINEIHDDILSMKEDISRASSYMDGYSECISNLERIKETVSCFSEVEKMAVISDEIEKFSEKISISEDVLKIRNRLNEMAGVLSVDFRDVDDEINDFIKYYDIFSSCVSFSEKEKILSERNKIASFNFDELEKIISECILRKKMISECESCVRKEKAFSEDMIVMSVDENEIVDLKNNLEELGEKISSAEKMLSEARNLWKKHTCSVKELDTVSSELSNSENEFRKLKNELGVCPLCGGELK